MMQLNIRKLFRSLAAVLLLLSMLFTLPAMADKKTEEYEDALDCAQLIADYHFTYGKLPDYFLTKDEAMALGWKRQYYNLSDAAPGMAIGGDYFGNFEGLLPKAKGRRYTECDCYYMDGPRNAYRLVFSNDGLYFFTADHYSTWVEIIPVKMEDEEASPGNQK